MVWLLAGRVAIFVGGTLSPGGEPKNWRRLIPLALRSFIILIVISRMVFN